ncbi:hypothetical protein SKAU_G00011820 [Synaphobranchus kaupii]|uniref:Uncharacterized protein n=1 Tax=Synaphobranchus kaupii TaxID=118154 RepID=A0A9Q1GA61_SYNKA|nr:hypothetical protein SKAU_G00011820 [Synaphobranchus kaupii]
MPVRLSLEMGALCFPWRRSDVKAGPWTPEASVMHPGAVCQLHRKTAGANAMQTFIFYASVDKLENRGNDQNLTTYEVGKGTANQRGCLRPDLAKEVANEGDALVVGGRNVTDALRPELQK